MKRLQEFYKVEEKLIIRGGKNVATVAELAQCYACAIASNIKRSTITEDDINIDMIKQAKMFVKSQNRKPIISSLTNEWTQSIVSIANTLFKEGYMIPNGIYHRNDKFTQDIYKNARVAAKNGGSQLTNSDKWNPGDIWISSATLNLKNAPLDSIESYNSWIKEKFNAKELIGISLKKPKNIKKPRLSIFNIDEYTPRVEYTGFSYKESKVDHDDAFFGNKHVYFFGKEDNPIKMQGRTFESTKFTAYALEVQGGAAAGGKIGWTIIRGFIEDLALLSGLPSYKEISNLAENDIDNLIYKMYEIFIKHANKTWSFDDFYKKLNKNPYRLFSQYYNLLIIDILESNPRGQSDNIFEKVFNHASSRVKKSSVYIKIN